MTTIYTKTETDTLLNTKESLTFSSQLTRTTNTIGINLSAYYNKTETDTLLNAKQPTLPAATNLLGVGSLISALDYTKITLNKPSTFPADMTTIYTKTETDTLLNAKQPTLPAATNLLGVGSSLVSALDYTKITLNKPSTFPADHRPQRAHAKRPDMLFQ
jgi:hypothetical protein